MIAPIRPSRRSGRMLLLLLAPPMLGGAAPPPPFLQPPATMDVAARCSYFSRLHRFAEQSKALCDEGRQVKLGPVTTRILSDCRATQGAALDQAPVTDLMDKLVAAIQSEGVGNACNDVSVQAWDLVGQ